MVFQGNQLALPLIFLLAFSDHMKQALGQFRENKFEKIHLCSDTLPGTEIVAASSRMSCAVSCADREYCTALSYLADGTCKLHRGNMASHTCSSSLASVAHYQKVCVGCIVHFQKVYYLDCAVLEGMITVQCTFRRYDICTLHFQKVCHLDWALSEVYLYLRLSEGMISVL